RRLRRPAHAVHHPYQRRLRADRAGRRRRGARLPGGRRGDGPARHGPGAGAVQRAFGTDGKSLQVGFAVETGMRAARLAAAGARADPAALDDWLHLVGGDPAAVDVTGPAVPDGLAIKLYPCCYALQRPISALSQFARDGLDPGDVTRIILRT